MQFQVPQFIEVEDKIFGPLTFKQFVYLGGGLGAAYIFWRILPIYFAGPLILGVGALAAALAFFQFNGRPFILALENAFFFYIRGKLYLWNNAKERSAKAQAALKPQAAELYVPRLSESRLHELAWSLDIKERVAQGVANDEERRVVRTAEDIVAPLRVARQALVR